MQIASKVSQKVSKKQFSSYPVFSGYYLWPNAYWWTIPLRALWQLPPSSHRFLPASSLYHRHRVWPSPWLHDSQEAGLCRVSVPAGVLWPGGIGWQREHGRDQRGLSARRCFGQRAGRAGGAAWRPVPILWHHSARRGRGQDEGVFLDDVSRPKTALKC